MAKENILTGKTETVGTMGSSKISGFGAGLLKGFKPSKFVKPFENKQNVWSLLLYLWIFDLFYSSGILKYILRILSSFNILHNYSY